jgi:ribulose-phosphate 3-epimerase
MEIKIAPSIFAADFMDIRKAVNLFEETKVDMIHYDVMDNHFVPNISFGPKFIKDIASKTNIPSDVHLMIDLDKNFKDYLDLPIESITIHLESANGHIMDYINAIRNSGKKAGLSLKPATPVDALLPYLHAIDLALIMSVEPGFSGQNFMPEVLDKIRDMKNIIEERDISIQVDGGVSRETYKQVLDAGADFLVIGSAFFKDKNPAEWVKNIKRKI